MPEIQEFQVYLAFDFGLRRIGVAVGQAITQSANPLPTLLAQRGRPDWKQIAELIQQWQPKALLVGLPFKMDGSEQGISFAARQFAESLKNRFHLPIYLVDERLTTREAKRRLSESGIKPKDLPSLDSYSAKLILESWLSNKSNV